VTNNEVAAEEATTLVAQGLRPGDPEWEMWGICEHITKPRVKAAITGRTSDDVVIDGAYKYTDEFSIAEGFAENAEFFTLTYETPIAVEHNLAYERIAPMLWLRAGGLGKRIATLPLTGWDVADAYGLLTDLDQASLFCKTLAERPTLRVAFIVTNDDRRFQAVARDLPSWVEPVRLYESYVSNFRFSAGD
jgi:adenine-specific DNA-methyltransferase